MEYSLLICLHVHKKPPNRTGKNPRSTYHPPNNLFGYIKWMLISAQLRSSVAFNVAVNGSCSAFCLCFAFLGCSLKCILNGNGSEMCRQSFLQWALLEPPDKTGRNRGNRGSLTVQPTTTKELTLDLLIMAVRIQRIWAVGGGAGGGRDSDTGFTPTRNSYKQENVCQHIQHTNKHGRQRPNNKTGFLPGMTVSAAFSSFIVLLSYVTERHICHWQAR